LPLQGRVPKVVGVHPVLLHVWCCRKVCHPGVVAPVLRTRVTPGCPHLEVWYGVPASCQEILFGNDPGECCRGEKAPSVVGPERGGAICTECGSNKVAVQIFVVYPGKERCQGAPVLDTAPSYSRGT